MRRRRARVIGVTGQSTSRSLRAWRSWGPHQGDFMPADSQNVPGLTLPTSITPRLLLREFEKLNAIFCRIPHSRSLGITSVPTLTAFVCCLETDTGLQATRKQQGPAFLQQVPGFFLQFLEDQKRLRA